MRIAIGQISCEANHFVGTGAETESFRVTGYLLEGEAMLTLAESNNEIGGALAALRAQPDAELIPLLAARGSLAGPLSSACYAELKSNLLQRLRSAVPLDGVFLSFHGSTCAADVDDTEGDLSAAARNILGLGVPIALSLDLHANVTRQMVESTGLIVGYRHYPHDDTFQTGERAAHLLLSVIRGDITPAAALVKLPMLLTAFNASTATPGPFAEMMDRCLQLESTGRLLSCSLFFVGSYIDVPEVGCSVLAISNGDAERAVSEAKCLAADYWDARGHFTVKTWSVQEVVQKGREIPGGPVLLLDTADTVGGGAAGA